MPTVLIPLPARDVDPSEAAVAWRVLTDRGIDVAFATPDGRPGRADDLMLSGEGLDPWGLVPGLRRVTVVGRVLRADANARAAWAAMAADPAFLAPRTWAAPGTYDALLLPGGHRARGMREYLESGVLQALVVDAFARGLPVAAICHGVLLAARSVDPATGRSVLHGRTTTALTWALERRAAMVARVTRFWDPGYYRTYREPVQAEVTRALARPEDFKDVPDGPGADRKRSGRARDTPEDPSPAFVVQDGSYVSARWPGDAHTWAARFAELL